LYMGRSHRSRLRPASRVSWRLNMTTTS